MVIHECYFSVVFTIILFVDIGVKIYLDEFPYRYISKPLVVLLLIIFYYVNLKAPFKSKDKYVFLGLLSFLLGDLFVINHLEMSFFVSTMLLFSLGKFFYCLKFTNTEDFSINRLVPFLTFCFIFMVLVFRLIFQNSGNYFLPVLIYFFVSLLMALFGFLRKNAVNKASYKLVFIGIIFFLISETIMVIKTFHNEIIFEDFLIMFAYGFPQYFIVRGLILENNKKA